MKGDPGDRRRFLDDLMVLRTPRMAGTKADYDRVLKQRNSLLKQARAKGGSRRVESEITDTLVVWDEHLARTGAEIMAARFELVDALRPYLGKAYAAVARGADRDAADLVLTPSFDLGAVLPEQGPLEGAFRAVLEEKRREELDRGVTLAGPHRDELQLSLGVADGLRLPVKGYASHGESWSFALALKLASYELLSSDGDDPILVLDDVFAELDTERRQQLASMVAGAEQVLVTAAVPDDVPGFLGGTRYGVAGGEVTRD